MRHVKHTLVIPLLSLGIAAAAAAAPAPPPSPADVLKEAVRLLDQRNYKEAAEAFQRADELAGGTCGPCLLGLSRAWLGQREIGKSIHAARQATARLKSPDLVSQAWNQLGIALMARPQPDLAGAEEAFRKAVETGGLAVNVSRYNLADVLWRRKEFGESERVARESLTSDPKGPAARNARIVLCQARTDGATAPPPEELYAEASCSLEKMRPVETTDQNRAEGKEVQRPEKIFGFPPSYDDQARADHVEGTVIVESIIDEEGCIQKLRLCKSVHPSLDRAALDAVRRWVFEPATLEEQPVKVYYTLTVNFQVGERPGPG